MKPPVDIKTIRDPHHDGCFEWCYHDRRFWQRHTPQQRWHPVKRVHLTKARLLAFITLVEEE